MFIFFIRHGAGTVGSQQSGSADSDGEAEVDASSSLDHDAPLLLRSISTDTEAAHSLAGPHTPLTPRKFQQQVLFILLFYSHYRIICCI